VREPSVTAYIANLNTAHATELCVRSMRHTAGYPFELVVGDSGSTDGSLAVLERFQGQGWLDLQVAPHGRDHADWLNGWLATCTTRYALFSDSDVEFRTDGWLRDMVETATESGAALLCGRMQQGSECYIHPVTRAERRLAPRPTAWLFMVDIDQVRGRVRPDCAYREVEDFRAFGGKIAYDTAAWYFKQLCEAGLSWAQMPASWQPSYHHYGGLTWLGPHRSGPAWHIRARQAAKLIIVEQHLRRARRERWGEHPRYTESPAVT
jgi:hypothetical protein